MSHSRIEQVFLAAAEVEGLGVGFWQGPGRIEHWTYKELAVRAISFGTGLQNIGVRAGDRVALVLSTSPEFYVAWFGSILAGAVPTALYPPARLGRIDEWRTRTAAMLKNSGSVFVVTEPRLYGFLGVPVSMAAPRLGCTEVQKVEEASAGEPLLLNADTEIAAVQFSSGSTLSLIHI